MVVVKDDFPPKNAARGILRAYNSAIFRPILKKLWEVNDPQTKIFCLEAMPTPKVYLFGYEKPENVPHIWF